MILEEKEKEKKLFESFRWCGSVFSDMRRIVSTSVCLRTLQGLVISTSPHGLGITLTGVFPFLNEHHCNKYCCEVCFQTLQPEKDTLRVLIFRVLCLASVWKDISIPHSFRPSHTRSMLLIASKLCILIFINSPGKVITAAAIIALHAPPW